LSGFFYGSDVGLPVTLPGLVSFPAPAFRIPLSIVAGS
jgi:hypothetical protein